MAVTWGLVRKLLFSLLLPTADLKVGVGKQRRDMKRNHDFFFFFSRLDGQVESA